MKDSYTANSYYLACTYFTLKGWDNVLFELGSERVYGERGSFWRAVPWLGHDRVALAWVGPAVPVITPHRSVKSVDHDFPRASSHLNFRFAIVFFMVETDVAIDSDLPTARVTSFEPSGGHCTAVVLRYLASCHALPCRAIKPVPVPLQKIIAIVSTRVGF